MGIVSEIIKGIMQPRKLLRRLYSDPTAIVERAVQSVWSDIFWLHSVYHRRLRNRTGISVIDEDWDNLIILDGCRYDLFSECNTLDGNLTSVISPASATKNFLERSFSDGEFHDVVYVTANPNCYVLDAEFHHIEPLWEDHWDESLETVRPEYVAQRAVELAQRFPEKRFIVHFIQPHYPFIGETGQEIEHSSLLGGGLIADERTRPTIWELVRDGNVDEGVAWRAYRENLELSLPHVERIVYEIDGKSVVTSDHGNAFGRWGIYGHPTNVFVPELVEVPWLEIEVGERKSITAGTGKPITSAEDQVEEQLTALGYR